MVCVCVCLCVCVCAHMRICTCLGLSHWSHVYVCTYLRTSIAHMYTYVCVHMCYVGYVRTCSCVVVHCTVIWYIVLLSHLRFEEPFICQFGVYHVVLHWRNSNIIRLW